VPGRFAPFGLPLMSNVRPREKQAIGARLHRRSLAAAPRACAASALLGLAARHARRHVERLEGWRRASAVRSLLGLREYSARSVQHAGSQESRAHGLLVAPARRPAPQKAPSLSCAVEHWLRSLALSSAVGSLQWRMSSSPASSSPWPNPSFERTASSQLRWPPAAAQLQR